MVENKNNSNPVGGFSVKWKIIGVVCLGLVALVLLLLRFTVVEYEAQLHESRDSVEKMIRELNQYVERLGVLSRYVAENKYVRERLQQQVGDLYSEPLNREVLIALYSIKQVAQADVVYVMNPDGLVIASTTYEGERSLTGENYRFRPYFTGAMAKNSEIYAALGVTTGKRGLYFSAPVLVPDSPIPQGVVVVKMGMEKIDLILANFPALAGIMSPEGVVFAGNRPDWFFKTALPIAPEMLDRLINKQQFGTKKLVPLPFLLNSPEVTLENKKYHLIQSQLSIPGWTGFVLVEINSAFPILIGFFTVLIVVAVVFLLILNILNNRKKRWLELEKLRASEEIHAQNEFLRTVLDSLSHPFYIINVDDYSVVMANRAGGNEELSGKEKVTCYSLTHGLADPCSIDANYAQCPVDAIKQTRQPVVLEHRIVSPEGKVRYHAIHAYPIFDTDGRLTRMIEYNMDITDRKQMEEELLKKRQLESIGILAGGIAHDFNNLLSVIIGNIEMVMDELPQGSQNHRFLESAERNAVRAADLSKKLISFSRAGWLERKVLHLPQLLPEVIGADFNQSGVSITCTFASDLFPVFGDERQLTQVFHHVIQNALDAVLGMPEASIKVLAENVGADDTAVLDQLQPLVKDARAHFVKILVVDTGKGIAKENVAKVFDPYFTTKSPCSEKGVGLGLTICYSIIKKHGGLISLLSEPHQGTTVKIYLPARPEGAGE